MVKFTTIQLSISTTESLKRFGSKGDSYEKIVKGLIKKNT